LHENQIALSDKGAVGERLGDNWLLPEPFRQLERAEQGYFEVSVWELQQEKKKISANKPA
jgi:hypothetical protein